MDKRPRLNEVSSRLRGFARMQRKDMPRGEALFWEQVRGGRFRSAKFKRQVPIAPFIADFYCASARLVVEIDGPVHEAEERRRRDEARDAWLNAQGFLVLRFSTDLVLSNLGAVMDAIGSAIEDRGYPSSASLREASSPTGGEFVASVTR
ncbi:endonuclease domain-containing protein [Methylorubrum rhodesianum]|uniref:endonuclease domain-containing protein n=1 Tax=Methylorubrum rhodesianum TaxID=29427 RepID=UPI00129CD5E8|nr:endonuclease domain-containing protein [Methylobacterium sp. DB1607]